MIARRWVQEWYGRLEIESLHAEGAPLCIVYLVASWLFDAVGRLRTDCSRVQTAQPKLKVSNIERDLIEVVAP